MGSDTRSKVLGLLSDCRPRSFSEIVKETGLGRKAVEGVLYRLWKEGKILRSERQFMEAQRIFKGRGGITRNLRKYYLYVLKPGGRDSVEIDGVRFVRYKKKERKAPRVSKARLIYEFLKSNGDKAFFSKEIAEALKDRGIKPPDVMTSVRRLERKGLVYVRGYRSGRIRLG